MVGSDEFIENEWDWDMVIVVMIYDNEWEDWCIDCYDFMKWMRWRYRRLSWFYGMNEVKLVGCYGLFMNNFWVVILLWY